MGTTAPARSSPLRGLAPSAFARPDRIEMHISRPVWLTAYTASLVLLDAGAMMAATLTAKISWLGINPESFHVRSFSIPYGALALATVPAWVVLLALAGAYDLGPFGTSSRTWMQVVRSGAQLLAVVALAYYVLHLAQLGRGVLVGLIPLAVALTLVERAAARLVLDQLRRYGHARRTALLVGHQRGVDALVQHIAAHPQAGVGVVGVSIIGTGRDDPASDEHGHTPSATTDPSSHGGTADAPAFPGATNGGAEVRCGATNGTRGNGPSPRDDGPNGSAAASGERPDIGRLAPITRSLTRTGAETVIIAGGLDQGQVRDIAWMLEGTGVALLVTTAPADLHELTTTVLRPVAGLPLLHLDS